MFDEMETWLKVLIYIGVVILFFMFIFGGTIMEMLDRRQVKFKDLDQLAHLRLYKELQKSARLAKGTHVKKLYLKSLDPRIFANERGGMLYQGRIKGLTIWQALVIIYFKYPGFISRKYIIIAPTEFLMSGEGDTNVILEGIGVRNFELDYWHPIPSKYNKWGNEHDIMIWSNETYRALMKIHSELILTDFGEYLLIKAGSDPTALRMAQQHIGSLASASETEYINPDQGRVQ